MLAPHRKKLIDDSVEALRASLGGVKAPVDDAELARHYSARDYTEMLRYIRNSMRLNLRLKLGVVTDGGPAAPAWVEMPERIPLFGTKEFKELQLRVFLRRSFIEKSGFEQLVVVLAHEMAHIVLDSIRHPLHRTEEAVDLTAMMLGYRDFFTTGCAYTAYASDMQWHQRLFDWFKETAGIGDPRKSFHIGYLKAEEVRYAAAQMVV